MNDDLTVQPTDARNGTLSVDRIGQSQDVTRIFGEESIEGDECLTLGRAGQPLATVRLNRAEAIMRAAPALGLDLNRPAARLAYVEAVLEFAARDVAESGRLLDVSDPRPERLIDPMADQARPRPTRASPIVHHAFRLGTLSGTICHAGAAEIYQPDNYQLRLDVTGSSNRVVLSFPSAASPCHERVVRVTPWATVVVVGLDETTTELCFALRGLGLNVIVAEQQAVTRRDRIAELTDAGYVVLDARDPSRLAEQIGVYASVKLVLEGYGSDTVLDPEERPETEAKALDGANRSTVLALREQFNCPVLFKDDGHDAQVFDGPSRRFLQESLGIGNGAVTKGNGFRFPLVVDAALLAAILPVLAPASSANPGVGAAPGSVEISVDVLQPTTVPYGARNRHAPDDVAVRVGRGAERRFLDLLDQVGAGLTEQLRPIEDPELRRFRTRALTIDQRLGPWTVHTVLDVEIRATRADGAPIRAADYKGIVHRQGDIRLVDFDDLGLDRDQVLALDGSQIQNIAFQKLGKIHHYRPTGVIIPLTDRSFKIILLVPQISGGFLNRLEAALALSGIGGSDAALLKRLAEEALDLPRIDARLADTFPARDLDAPPDSLRGRRAAVASGTVDDATFAVPSIGKPPLGATEVSADGHTITTHPPGDLDWDDPRQRGEYLFVLLDYLRQYTIGHGGIVRLYGEHARDVKRFLADAAYVQDPAISGLARAPFALGPLIGTRLRLGSDRVPEADRLIQVDFFRRDDLSDNPASVTVTFAIDEDAPLIAMPTTVQLVCGIGNIAGDIGVLERRLGYRVVGWNRSPNERARHALENGIPLYEFDEGIGQDGKRIVQSKQRAEYGRHGLPLAGTVRDLLDNGLMIGTTDRGRPVKAHARHILDGLFGSSRHPITGKSTKNSEIYRELLFAEYEARGIPTIYNGYNTPEIVAAGRIFVHDAFRTGGVDPAGHFGETGDARKSIMCVSCNTTNITSVLLQLIATPGLSELVVRVLTNRKTCDPFVGEGKQTVNYQGMAFEFNYHHWEDSKLFFDAVRDAATRERLGQVFAREVKEAGGEPEWAISTHATVQAGTEFHVGLVHLSGKLNGGPLDAAAIKNAIANSGVENVQVIDFPGDRINSTQFLATLHQRIGMRDLHVQPCMVVQDAADVIVVFFTPHLYNVKPNNLVAALNRDGLVANTKAGLDAATRIVADALRLDRERAALRRYYPLRQPAPAAKPASFAPIYFFGTGASDSHSIGSAEARRQLLGGKGAGLAEMAAITYDDPITGRPAPIPVPPGYTITTEQCHRYFYNEKCLPTDLVAAIDAAQTWLETTTGKRLGDLNNPLLVSVRSGAAVSMPGMMDTILNLGLNDRVVEALAAQTGDPVFAWDSYQRFVEMYAEVVLGVSRARHLRPARDRVLGEHGLPEDATPSAAAARQIVEAYKSIVRDVTGHEFPDDPREQLLAAVTAVFDSSYSERAITYRQINGIAPTVISAVNVVTMIFGNLSEGSATGVAFTRDPLTGERGLNGEYLTQAQGEDVVRGIRTGQKIAELANEPDPTLGDAYRRLAAIAEATERHFRDAQDLEFTVERGVLWLLQTRRLGGRTGRAALRIATDLVDEGLVSEREAVLLFGDPKGLSELLAPIFDPRAEAAAQAAGRLLTRGIAASSGAACGRLVVSSDRAEALSHQGERVILVRPETSPEDVGGLHSAQGVLTARGGIVSHAAIVARGIGRPAVVGASDLTVDEIGRRVTFAGRTVEEGEIISVNGTTGTVYLGELPVVPSPIKQKVGGRPIDSEGEEIYRRFLRLLGWASAEKAMEIRANAETPKDLAVALALGAEGIGLARTEHAVLEPAERRISFSALILATSHEETEKALAVLEPPMEEEVYQIFRLLEGKPATIRLYDPVPNEFLPRSPEEAGRIANFLGVTSDEIRARSAARAETNPMLGHRGVRLYVVEPAIAEMQVRATLRAAARASQAGIPVQPEIQIPLVINRVEIGIVAETIRRAASATFAELGVIVPYKIGVMVETPAAVRTADEYAADIEFFSLGVNDLSQTVLAVSRDDTARFIGHYETAGILNGDPFRSIDPIVGSFIAESVERARRVNPNIWIFSAGDVGGDPPSVNLFHDIGLDGVSAGPWLIPLGILSAAQANIRRPRAKRRDR